MEAAGRIRLFFAVEAHPSWTSWLRSIHAHLELHHGSTYRRVAPDLWHLTVLFVGDQPRSRLTALREAGTRASQQCGVVRLRANELVGNSRVLWLSVSDVRGDLRRLSDVLRRECAGLGLAFDPRPLVPHVTLARARRGSMPRPVTASAPPPPGEVQIPEFRLVRSVLGPGGPTYTVVERWPLSPGRSDDL